MLFRVIFREVPLILEHHSGNALNRSDKQLPRHHLHQSSLESHLVQGQ